MQHLDFFHPNRLELNKEADLRYACEQKYEAQQQELDETKQENAVMWQRLKEMQENHDGLLAEVRAYGLQNLVEGQAQMPPSHAAVADKLAAEVGRVVSEELEHFSDQKTWSEDPKYPQHP